MSPSGCCAIGHRTLLERPAARTRRQRSLIGSEVTGKTPSAALGVVTAPFRYATIAELRAHPPDVIVAVTSNTVAAPQKAMPAMPIVFASIYEPVAQGFVQSLAHPGGNATGFTMPPASPCHRLRSEGNGCSCSRR
jgi:hypothetical protein